MSNNIIQFMSINANKDSHFVLHYSQADVVETRKYMKTFSTKYVKDGWTICGQFCPTYASANNADPEGHMPIEGQDHRILRRLGS
jgi:hypothetical protein